MAASNLRKLSRGSLLVAGVFWVLGILAPFAATLVVYGAAELIPNKSDPGVLATGLYMAVAMFTVLLAFGAMGLAMFGAPILHLIGAVSAAFLTFRYGKWLRGGALLSVHAFVLVALASLLLAAAIAPALPELPELPDMPSMP